MRELCPVATFVALSGAVIDCFFVLRGFLLWHQPIIIDWVRKVDELQNFFAR